MKILDMTIIGENDSYECNSTKGVLVNGIVLIKDQEELKTWKETQLKNLEEKKLRLLKQVEEINNIFLQVK